MEPTNADDEIRILNEGWRLLGRDVQAELVARGWAVTDLAVDDNEPLEFFWPPTAPIGYGSLPERGNETARTRAEMYGARPTPWARPTRILRTGTSWSVEYGEAIGRAPDAAISHESDQALLDDLARIEWWPMAPAEARRIRDERILHTTHADAYDQHSLGYSIRTEPYESRLRAVYDRIRSTIAPQMKDPEPDAWRWAGDLRARARIIDGEMWASAIRTARAGGEGWGPSGPESGVKL